jgi:hypothetical protein
VSVDRLRARDEVLQVLYWMLGEAIAHEADARFLAKFLDLPETVIAQALVELHGQSLLFRGGLPESFRLSQDGIREGGRRFRDEFADLTKQAHGECMPGCSCHTPEGEGKPCPSTVAAANA